MFKKPAFSILVVSVSVVTLLVAITSPATMSLHGNTFFKYESAWLEPLFIFSSLIAVSASFLLFFNHTIQTRWWRWARWFMLASVPVILTGATTGVTWFHRTDLALVCGVVLFGSTIAYVLVHRFYFKTGV